VGWGRNDSSETEIPLSSRIKCNTVQRCCDGKRSYEQLSLRERIEIYRLHADGKSLRFIAGVVERNVATISRELKRNSKASKKWTGGYDPQRAQTKSGRRFRVSMIFSHSAFSAENTSSSTTNPFGFIDTSCSAVAVLSG